MVKLRWARIDGSKGHNLLTYMVHVTWLSISNVDRDPLNNKFAWLRLLGLAMAWYHFSIGPHTLSFVQVYPHRATGPHDSCWAHFLALIVLLLSEKLSTLKLEVEEISLTSASQRRKLGIILEAINRSLQVEEQEAKWSVESMWD